MIVGYAGRLIASRGWRLEFGDRDAIAWVIVGAYAAATILVCIAFAAARRAERALAASDPIESRNQRTLKRFWLLVGLTTAALGLNKQLDLQTAFTNWVRDRAYANGWYDDRRRYQKDFIVSIAALGALATAGLALSLRRVLHRVIGAVVGLGMLVSFVVIRASSLHQLDVLLNEGTIRPNWVLELGGILLIAVSAWRASVKSRRAIAALSADAPPRQAPPAAADPVSTTSASI